MTYEHLRALIDTNNEAYRYASSLRLDLHDALKHCTADQHDLLLRAYNFAQAECGRLGHKGEMLGEKLEELEY